MPVNRADSDARGFIRVAKRLAGWTSNLLVSAVVVMVGLAFGRQLTSWWAFDAKDTPESVLPTVMVAPHPLGDDGRFRQLEFGDLPVRLGRRTIAGDTAAVLAALRAECRRAVEQGLPTQRNPGPEERKMLEGTAGMVPVEQVPGRWRMYQLDRPLPLVAVTDDGDVGEATGDKSVAGRVLCWGFGFPAGEGGAEWTLFTGVPVDASASLAASPLGLPLPPGAERQMLLRGEDEEGVLIFSGSGDAAQWQSFLDAWFQQRGWGRGDGWRDVGGTRHCRYEDSEGRCAAEVLMEVQGELRVMLTATRQ
ncbi:MAG: hypothetical protein KJ000_14285 [Pirellulaceae bacterium]|nr:hypothetical protein [Pirellulaceae bacterium]